MTDHRVANRFMLQGIQNWGQSEAEREKATRDYVEAAGFKYGTAEALAWLTNILRSLKRGQYENEIAQLNAALEERRAAQ